MITILRNELQHHQIDKPEINQEIFKKRSVTGDMVLTRINLSKEKDLKNYLNFFFSFVIDNSNF